VLLSAPPDSQLFQRYAVERRNEGMDTSSVTSLVRFHVPPYTGDVSGMRG
jgi:hypothetical protein